jgi:hypothetical protein
MSKLEGTCRSGCGTAEEPGILVFHDATASPPFPNIWLLIPINANPNMIHLTNIKHVSN